MDRPLSASPGAFGSLFKTRGTRVASLLCLLVAGAAVVRYSGAWGLVGADSQKRSLSVREDGLEISSVRRAPFESYVATRGRVQAEHNLALESLEGGRVEELFVKNGDSVTPGQPIARIYNPALAFEVLSLKTRMSAQLLALHGTQNSLAESAFSRKQAQAKVEFERKRWKRRLATRSRMQAKGAVGLQDVQDAQEELEFREKMHRIHNEHEQRRQSVMRMQLKEMKNAADSLQQSYEIAKERLDSLNIKAPRGGEISQLQLELGATVQSGSRIASLLVQGPNKVEAQVDEFFIDRLSVGQRGRLDLKGQTADLEVSLVDPVVRAGKVRVDLRFSGEEPEGLFRGQAVDLRIFEGSGSEKSSALVIPRGAFFESRDGQHLFVLNKEGDAAYARTVRLGRSNRKYVEVLDGLKEGDRVITSSYEGLEKATKLSLSNQSTKAQVL